MFVKLYFLHRCFLRKRAIALIVESHYKGVNSRAPVIVRNDAKLHSIFSVHAYRSHTRAKYSTIEQHNPTVEVHRTDKDAPLLFRQNSLVFSFLIRVSLQRFEDDLCKSGSYPERQSNTLAGVRLEVSPSIMTSDLRSSCCLFNDLRSNC